jgi:hypothetical protein
MIIWKPVVGYENLYSINTLGEVRSLKDCQGKYQQKLLTSRVRAGYLSVTLYKEGIRKDKCIHRLLAESFIDNPNNKLCVNHINGIKTDNRIENLEWVTHKENTRHSWDIGLSSYTEKQRNSISERSKNKSKEWIEHIKLSVSKVRSIKIKWYHKEYGIKYCSASELIDSYPELKLSNSNLSLVYSGKRKQHKGWYKYE